MPAVKPSSVATDEIASIEWDRLLAAMPPGIYTALDVSTLAQYALAWSMFVKAQQDLDLHGYVLYFYDKDDDGKPFLAAAKTNPAARLWKAATETLLKCGDRLGLSPGVRSRLSLPKPGDKTPESRFAGLLGKTPA